MIIKHISKGPSTSARRYVRVLMTYSIDPDPRKQVDPNGLELALTLDTYVKGEKKNVGAKADVKRVLASGAAISGSDIEWMLASEEMERRLANRSKHIKKPVRHSIASFRHDELPSEDHHRQAVDLLTDELGCRDGVTFWAAHGDTDNIHIHIIHVPIDKDGDVLPFGADGKYKEAMQRAIARIEHAQTLTPEVGSRYEIVDGNVARRPEQASPPTSSRSRAPLREETLRFERGTGVMSFTRFCQERVAHHVEDAANWDEVHRNLAPLGVGIRRSRSTGGTQGKGSGGIFYTNDANEVKLSNIGRGLSWPQLCKPERLGPYQPPSPALELSNYVPVIMDAEQAKRRRDDARVKDEAKALLTARIDALQAARRATEAALKAEWIRHRTDAQALKIARIRKRELIEALRRIHTKRIRDADQQFAARVRALRGVRRGLDGIDHPEDLDMNALGQADCMLVTSWSPASEAEKPIVDFEGFERRRECDALQYWRINDPDARQPAFVERGNFIWVEDRSEDVLAVALLLAKARHGDVAAFGDADFVRRCQLVGCRMNLDVANGGRVLPKPPRAWPNIRQSARDRALDAEIAASLDRVPTATPRPRRDDVVRPSAPSAEPMRAAAPAPVMPEQKKPVKPRRVSDLGIDR